MQACILPACICKGLMLSWMITCGWMCENLTYMLQKCVMSCHVMRNYFLLSRVEICSSPVFAIFLSILYYPPMKGKHATMAWRNNPLFVAPLIYPACIATIYRVRMQTLICRLSVNISHIDCDIKQT